MQLLKIVDSQMEAQVILGVGSILWNTTEQKYTLKSARKIYEHTKKK